jgi:hypothetical protein
MPQTECNAKSLNTVALGRHQKMQLYILIWGLRVPSGQIHGIMCHGEDETTIAEAASTKSDKNSSHTAIPTHWTFTPAPQQHIRPSKTVRSPAPAPLIQAQPQHHIQLNLPPST